MSNLINEVKKYKGLNEYAEKGQVAVFGDTYTAHFPFYDLMQGKVTDYAVYNRSMDGITVKEASDIAEYCLYHLQPATVLLCFGEKEVQDAAFVSEYRFLIEKIKSIGKKCKICLLEHAEKPQNRISDIAVSEKCNYVFIPSDMEDGRVFHKLNAFFRGGKISFWDAFSI